MGSYGFAHLILAATVIISFIAFNNGELMFKSFFIPTHIKDRKEYWRFFSHGFVHADMNHLLFNMLTLFFFGPYVEQLFEMVFGAKYFFLIFYFAALLVSSIPSYYKHKEDQRYRALGASGAVSAVLFTFVAFNPWESIYIFFAIPIPGILFAVLYIWYSAYMSKQNRDNIGHDAHLWGAVFGFVFPFIVKPSLIQLFIKNITNIPFLQ